MARNETHAGILPSVLDRLIDPDAEGTAWRRGYGPQQVIDAVQRDLQDLLNTRESHQGPAEDGGLPADLPEVQRSIYAYGLPDLTSLNATTPQQREEIGQVLEATIAQFEPRLKDIRATLLDPGDGKERTVRFRIEARLNMDPAPDVAFDTILELTTGRYSVSRSAS